MNVNYQNEEYFPHHSQNYRSILHLNFPSYFHAGAHQNPNQSLSAPSQSFGENLSPLLLLSYQAQTETLYYQVRFQC